MMISSPRTLLSEYQQSIGEACATVQEGSIRSLETVWTQFTHDNITAVGTAFIAIFTLTLWRSTRALWLAGEKQIAVAHRAATAASRQVDAIVAIVSPIMIIPEIKLVGYADEVDPASTVDPVLTKPIPNVCRAFVGLGNFGRSQVTITHFCLQCDVLSSLPMEPHYRPEHTQNMQLLVDPRSQQVNFFGLGHPRNPIVLTPEQRQKMDAGETLWVFGFFSYLNFMQEPHDLGFIARWSNNNGLVAEPNPRYSYLRTRVVPSH
jgi:hypothetical protein